MSFPSHILSGFSLCFILAACQTVSLQPGAQITLQQDHAPKQQSARPLDLKPKPAPAPVSYQPKVVPFAVLEPFKSETGEQKIHVKVTYPAPVSGFRTQSFGCDEVAAASIQVTGPGLSAPIYADGSDPGTHQVPASNCSITATLSAVPYGDLVVTIKLYDAQDNLLTGSELKGALQLNSTSQNLELSYRQRTAADLLEALRQGPIEDQFLAGQIDLSALQTFIDDLMQLSGSFPNYSFGHHPSLLKIQALVADLRAQQGDLSLLDANGPKYIWGAGSVRFNLAGYLINQTITASVDDSLSPNLQLNANGQATISNLPPGSWQLRLSGPGYLSQWVPITVLENQQSDLSTLSIYPPQPTLSSLSASNAPAGSELNLIGTNFNATLANNIVTFGSTLATVTAATGTSLTVTVPNVSGSGLNVNVTIAGQTSGNQSFSVTPNVTSLSAASGSTGDSIVITGTGFNATPANNTVNIGGTAVTVTDASATSLTITVPERPAGGSLNLTVQVGSQTSAASSFSVLPKLTALATAAVQGGKAVLIRSETLTITGTNFDTTAANNTVKFGAISATPDTATATQLTVAVPATVDVPGDVSITVETNTQTSNAILATVPSVTLNVTGGGFH